MKRTRKSGGGRKPKPEGEKAVTRSFSMPPASASALAALHGDKPLGKWLMKRLKLPK